MKGFKDFVMRGNLVELAVAFVMGAAFATVVKAFTDLFLSIISKVFGGKRTSTSSRPASRSAPSSRLS